MRLAPGRREVDRIEPSSFVGPRDPLELELALLWQAVLELPPVSVRANFFDLGGTSLDLARVASRIRERFDQDLPLAAFFQHQTIEELAGRLRDRGGGDDGTPLVRLRRGAGEAPAYFVHEVYGDVTYAYDLASLLGEDRPAYGFQPPGLYTDREPLRDLRALAAEYVDAARRLHPGGPYLLAGYCTGGIVALEMAHQLRRAGDRVGIVALIDSRLFTPEEATALAGTPDLDNLLYSEFVVHDQPISFEKFVELGRDRQVEYIVEGWKQIDLAPANAGPSFVRRFVDMYQVNAAAIATYQPELYDGKVCLYLPSEPVLPDQELPSVEQSVASWHACGVADLDIHQLPGHHFSLFSRPNVEALGFRLRACIAEV